MIQGESETPEETHSEQGRRDWAAPRGCKDLHGHVAQQESSKADLLRQNDPVDAEAAQPDRGSARDVPLGV
jgi:hypothetical protein